MRVVYVPGELHFIPICPWPGGGRPPGDTAPLPLLAYRAASADPRAYLAASNSFMCSRMLLAASGAVVFWP